MKKTHFDYVFLWRKGDWYVTFFHDSIILNNICDKVQRTVNSEVGFYKNKIDTFIDLLVSHGHKVLRIEQVETGEQNAKRLESKEDKEKFLKREIFSKHTPGTH
jgi:DNA mismatch repair ATPase MutS